MNFLIFKALAATVATTGTILNPMLVSQTTTSADRGVFYSNTASAPSALDAWIDDLVQAESEGKTHIKILDVNGYYSYGCLQFQKWTFIHYGLQYNVLTEDDLPNVGKLIYDCNLQKQLAKLMITDHYRNWRQWYNSTKKLGLPPKETALAEAQ